MTGISDIKVSLMGVLSKKALVHVIGTTDSELAAALFMDKLCPDGNWLASYPLSALQEALSSTIKTILDLIEKAGGEQGDHSALNFAVTDGEKLVCTRFASPPSHEPPSLYYSTTEGATLDRQYEDDPDGPAQNGASRMERRRKEEHASHIVVASEPCTYNQAGWHMLDKNTMLAYGKSEKVYLTRVLS